MAHGDIHDCGECLPDGLTKNEALVWLALSTSDEPLKAYEILDHLKENGVRAPMTVYRALSGLEKKGHIHKIDDRNAFILCNHGEPHLVQTFLVCQKCTNVTELHMTQVEADILQAVTAKKFALKNARLEIKGDCEQCAA